MPSKSKPLNTVELAAHELKRDLAGELLQSVREMQAGKVHVVTTPVIEARTLLAIASTKQDALTSAASK